MEKSKKKFFYISETNIPSKSANSIHVAKMIEAASARGYDTNLIVPYCNSILSYKKFYNIKGKINVISILKKKKNINFFYRIIFAVKVFFFLKKKKDCNIISRSVLSSLILSTNKIVNTVEIHHSLKGMTNFIFKLINKNISYYLNFVLIHKNLKKILNLFGKNVLVLDDAVNLKDFSHKKKLKKNDTIVYIGSFFLGKGLDLIYSIAKLRPNYKFDLYGDTKNIIKSNYKLKNLNFLGHVEYNKIPEILAKYNYAIMPYGEKVNVQSSNLDVSNTMSPLKMFDYLASSQVIFATDTSVYKHILKNNYNCVLIKHDKVYKWIKAIDDLKKNLSLKIKLKKNALKTAKKYTWDLRFKLIEKKFFTSLL